MFLLVGGNSEIGRVAAEQLARRALAQRHGIAVPDAWGVLGAVGAQ